MRLIDADKAIAEAEEFFKDVCVYDVAPFRAQMDFEEIIDSVPEEKVNTDYKAMWEELKRFTQDERDFFNSTRKILTGNSVKQAQDVLTDIVRFQCLDSVLDNMNDIEIDYMIKEKSNEQKQ